MYSLTVSPILQFDLNSRLIDLSKMFVLLGIQTWTWNKLKQICKIQI